MKKKRTVGLYGRAEGADLWGSPPRRRRLAILERDAFTCYYCGMVGTERTMNLDHKEPRSKGGSNEASNLVATCISCNTAKGSLTEQEYRLHLPEGLH